MSQWFRKRSLPLRVLLYAVVAILAFGLAAGAGAMGALMVRGDLTLPGRGEPRSSDGQANAARPQAKKPTAELGEAEYADMVGKIQSSSVDTLSDTNDNLLLYDAITADDVEEMRDNAAKLRRLAGQTADLDPPAKLEEHHSVFSSAIGKIGDATQLAYELSADPTAATQSGFQTYDRYVDEAATGLRRSNEIIDRDYKTIEGMQNVSPLT